MNAPLAGRAALITGGSRGIGAASASALASLGAHVVLTYRFDIDAGQRLVDKITEAGGSAEGRRLDIADPTDIAAFAGALAASERPIDILVANAAAGYPKVPLKDLDVSDLTDKVTADLRATHLLTTALAPTMRARGFGRLIYVSSGHADGPTAPGMTANGTSKAALEAYVTFVVDELTGNGVTANIVRPGLVATHATRGRLPAPVRGVLTAATPAAREATPADIAEVIAFLASAGEMVNGVRIPVTGGLNTALSVRRIATVNENAQHG